MRSVATLVAALAILSALSALAGTTVVHFTDASQVNLLERWNSDGTYYYEQSRTPTNVRLLSDATAFRAALGGLYTASLPSLTSAPTGIITFDAPVSLDRLMLQWRDFNHTPTWWEVYDQNDNLIAAGTRDLYSDDDGSLLPFLGTRNYTVGDGTLDTANTNGIITSLKVVTSQVSGNNCMDLSRLGAYLAPGSNIAMDGTFDVFREEVPKNAAAIADGNAPTMVVTASRKDSEKGTIDINQVGRITNGLLDGNRFTCGWAGEIVWTLSQPYRFTGAYLSELEDNNNAVVDVTIDVFNGTKWVTVFGPANVSRTSYLVFDKEVVGSEIRMSWSDSGDVGVDGQGRPTINGGAGRELNSFQLFGAAIPEPATMSLLVLGGLAMLRRRR